MKSKIVSLAAAFVLVLGTLILGSASASGQACPSLYVVNANGTAQQGPGAALANSYRGQPGTVVLDSPVMPDSFDASTNANSQWVHNTLAELDRTCPGTPKRVIGWSAAAEAAGNGVNSYARAGGDNSEVVLHQQSDPRRAEGNGGIDTRLLFFLPGITMDGPRTGGYGGATVISECNIGRDIVCDFPPVDIEHAAEIARGVFGYATGGHADY